LISRRRLKIRRALAAERRADVTFVQADVHKWAYPEATFDVVVDIFIQFSALIERQLKWAGMRRALKPGGLLVLQGYTPKQLEYDSGGYRGAVGHARVAVYCLGAQLEDLWDDRE
jgi:ubiquinone/menaquinone biosynthesis C-methylase UbiE